MRIRDASINLIIAKRLAWCGFIKHGCCYRQIYFQIECEVFVLKGLSIILGSIPNSADTMMCLISSLKFSECALTSQGLTDVVCLCILDLQREPKRVSWWTVTPGWLSLYYDRSLICFGSLCWAPNSLLRLISNLVDISRPFSNSIQNLLQPS